MAEKGLTYGTYLKIPERLTLQRTVADPPQHDPPRPGSGAAY